MALETLVKRHDVRDTFALAKRASEDIEAFLWKLPGTIEVINVEDDPFYQKKDVDLIWRYVQNEVKQEKLIEIKGDRYHHTKNYFFETVSNKDKKTPGCFMYTEADYVFYYFIEAKELHIIPTEEARTWFKSQMHRFKERETSTPVGKDTYITIGRLVPRWELKKNVPSVRIGNI